jgi:phage/plasmid-like protein (TIGR03299 family)
MPDEVETFAGREPAWHRKGNVVGRSMRSVEALEFGGLDWVVEKWPVVGIHPDLKGDLLKVEAVDLVDVDGGYVTVRMSDRKVLGKNIGERYVVRQNADHLAIADAILDADGRALVDTVGALRGGKQCFATYLLPEDALVLHSGVEVRLYLVVAWSHDTSIVSQLMINPVVVVCANTLNLAFDNVVNRWTWPHDDSGDAAIGEVREQLGLVTKYTDVWTEEMDRLAELPLDKAGFEAMVRSLFPGKAATGSSFTAEQYALIGVLESSPNIMDGLRYTGWGALNAVREYDDWHRQFRGEDDEERDDARLEATWWGRNVKRAQQVFDYLKGDRT